ncbi:hypothetical protein AMK01_PD00329 (plasmid) [Rhizobium sp. N6212]|nr:hypothetical protein AMK01_PD00329 [Rhizobium sp. N6212]ANL01261.1 hypothetical protein AMK00_PD00328 [Rhizobium sp. N621]ANL07384.1 hypothetical protein AMJ99_PD00330 [Rhizobium esperanzae]ANL13554.1 hypothetical protein AMJ98_PE00330 [Rhizobium sp. N1341]ANM38227.1 hypothetical protein AMK04_PD00331 [Rhizobium sp. N871]ANM44379.1 hypothetical protein AMK03_PE00331 [Rhizobium sp. N741]
MLALTVLMLIWEGPGVIRDFQISQNPLALEDGDVQNGRCTTRKLFFTDCSVRLVYSYDGRNYDTEADVMFVDFHTGDYETGVVISADHPELATISLGLDKLWNRIITLSTFALLLGGMSLGTLFQVVRIWRVKRHLRQPALLNAIPVEITAFDRKRNILSVTYNDKIASDKTDRSVYTRMKKGEEPLIVGEANGKAVGLAVRHGKTALPVLLDNRLQRVELTETERNLALSPFARSDADQAVPVLSEQPKKTMSIGGRLRLFFGTMLLILGGLVGFWLWYVTSASTPFQSPGMDINNLMPTPLNKWGCIQLRKRFGQDRAPFGCVADDYTSWKY